MQAILGGPSGALPASLGPAMSGAGRVTLRPLRRSDGADWRRIRIRDEKLLRPWDVSGSMTWEQRHSRPEWRRHRVQLQQATARGEAFGFAIEVDPGAAGGEPAERFAGQVTFGAIQRGALRSGWVGYWVDSELHNRGVASAAVAIGVDYAFTFGGLHRVEATIAPANEASQKVVRRLGFRQEGLLKRYLDIDGAWRDHLLFALTVEDVPNGVMARLRRRSMD